MRRGDRALAVLVLALALALALALGAVACSRNKRDQEPVKAAVSSSAALAGGKFVVTSPSPSDGELGKLLASEAMKAKQRGLRPFAEIRADWCGPCKEIEAALSDPRMIEAFTGTYQIRLDADAWGDQLAAAGLASNVIPIFFELDDGGKTTGRTIDGGAWGEDTPENMAPPLKGFFRAK